MHPFSWNFDRVLVTLPFLEFPIYWYGLFFATGLYIAQKWFTKQMLDASGKDLKSLQNFISISIISIIFFSRFVDVIFYQDVLSFLAKPWHIFDLRSGGLSSHGGVLGFLVSLYFYSRKLRLSFFYILAKACAPSGILAGFIRLGNLFNQEILGKPYSGFGSFIFLKPFDQSLPIPRHPVVIYEAIFYFLAALVISRVSCSNRRLCGISLLAYFAARFGLETLKEEQSIYNLGSISMGMYLSIPLILLGIYWVISDQNRSSQKTIGL